MMTSGSSLSKERVNRRQVRKTDKYATIEPVTFIGVGNLFVLAEGDGAAPVIDTLQVTYLQTDQGILAQGANFSSPSGVNI